MLLFFCFLRFFPILSSLLLPGLPLTVQDALQKSQLLWARAAGIARSAFLSSILEHPAVPDSSAPTPILWGVAEIQEENEVFLRIDVGTMLLRAILRMNEERSNSP